MDNSKNTKKIDTYTYDNKSLLKNSKRFFPIMGEIHYSRYPQKFWKEELLKMKAGGVDIVSAYTIWIHHEEIENEWDFSDSRDLRKFVQLIQECDLKMCLRIGPWVHAEVRNGGFPDWLLKKCPNARTNDENYFSEVEKFYKKIYEQVQGLFLKDGGPIIAVQIENEFGHCGGLFGKEGETHMKRLEKMAKEIGFDVPLYTATGWGGAVTAGMLPVMGGYCDSPWDPRPTEIEPSGNFVFTYERNDHAIGSDFGLGEGLTFDMKKYPYLTAELGGGLQVTYKRRPVAQGKDISAMSLAKLGSGCNLLGYYMYHGGCNPEGKLSTLEENKATGSINDLSVKNYDFRAPLGEYGFSNSSYDEIKLYALFVHDFGEEFCETQTLIPKENPVKPENLSDLRKSFRISENGTSYVFVNNYQRLQKMAEHKNVILSKEFPPVDIKNADFFFLPFNMKLKKSVLRSALVSPLCKLDDKTFVFYSAARPKNQNLLEKSEIFDVKNAPQTFYNFDFKSDDENETLVTLSREDALKSHKIFDKNKNAHLLISDSEIFETQSGEFTVCATKETLLKVYPPFTSVPENLIFEKTENGFAIYKVNFADFETADVSFTEETANLSKKSATLTENAANLSDSSAALSETSAEQSETSSSSSEKSPVTDKNPRKFSVKISNIPQNASDILLDISYVGNCARLYKNQKLVDDQIFCGTDYKWLLGLKRFSLKDQEFTLEIDALEKSQKANTYLEKWPSFDSKENLQELIKIETRTEQRLKVTL